MRILITGAAGMLGTDARRHFSTHGYHVISADLTQGGDIEMIDITAPDSVIQLFKIHRPDIVLHAAAYTNVDGCERDPETAFHVNARGSQVVAAAAEEIGATLVAISTDFVFDGTKREPYVESDEPNPLSRYGASKLAGEKAALETCSRTYVVRTSWLHGVHGKNFAFAIINRARAVGALEVVADQVGTPTFTQDLVLAVEEIIGTSSYGIYHASNDGQTTWHAFAEAILAGAGLENVPVTPLSSAEYAAKSGSPTVRPPYSVLANRAMQVAGFAPMRPWEAALDEFIADAKAAGKI